MNSNNYMNGNGEKNDRDKIISVNQAYLLFQSTKHTITRFTLAVYISPT